MSDKYFGKSFLETFGEKDDSLDVPSTFDSAASDAAEAFAERMEYELRGAWRAGYDYLHVYDDLGMDWSEGDGLPGKCTLSQYVFPAYEGGSRPDPPDLVYRHSYDLTSVSDDVIRQAIREAVER